MVFTRRNVDWWCERGILLLVLATLVFAPLALGAVDTWAFLIVQALAVGIGLVWLIRIWAGHEPKLLWPPLNWAVMAFVVYALARYFTADIEYVNHKGSRFNSNNAEPTAEEKKYYKDLNQVIKDEYTFDPNL